jgi:hypothetical protein
LKRLKRVLFFISVLLAYQLTNAQIGGTTTYQFLALSPSARVTALGGTNVSLMGADPSTQLSNPASLNPQMDRHVEFSSAVYPGDINFGNASYVQNFKVPGTFGFGIQYIAYGTMDQTDEAANITGKFTAGEMNAYAGYGYQFGKIFSAGANLKFVYSQLASWNSEGMAADLAAMVNDTAHNVTAAIVAKNLGGEMKPYNKGVTEPIPFDLQAGVSFGFKHVPFKFHFTFHDLYRWNIRYNNPADDAAQQLFVDSAAKPKTYIVDNLMSHVIIGLEFNIKKVVRLEIAYNHERQQEMALTTKLGVPGLSFGAGIHIRQFDFSYAFQPMPQGQTLNYFTLSVNTGGFVKHKTVNKDSAYSTL